MWVLVGSTKFNFIHQHLDWFPVKLPSTIRNLSWRPGPDTVCSHDPAPGWRLPSVHQWWPQETAAPRPPLVTLSCCDTSGAPGAVPDFALLPQDQTVTSWRLTTASSVQSLESKIRTPASLRLLCCDFFCSITSLLSRIPGVSTGILWQFLVFSLKLLTPKKVAFFSCDSYLELNIWNSNQSNENFVRS